MNEHQHEEVHDIMIDSSISQSRHVDLERELSPWVPDDDNPECPELDNTFDRHWNRLQALYLLVYFYWVNFTTSQAIKHFFCLFVGVGINLKQMQRYLE